MNFNIKKGNCEVTINMDCDNTNDNGNEPQIHPDNLKKVDPSNADNPYDEVGELHNYAMKRIFLVPGVKEFNKDEVAEQLAEIIERYPTKSKYLRNLQSYDVKETIEKIGDDSPNSFQTSFIYPPTPEQEEYLNPFLRDLVQWLGSTVGNFNKYENSLVDYINDAKSYEKRLVASNLDRETKEASLISMSIMRHSSIMYLEHFNNNTGVDDPVIFGKKCQCMKVARVAVADLVGALTGIPGGAVGVVVGAVVGSGKQFIEETK